MARKTPRTAARPELYNPVVVSLLAILFTPIFGAQLQALNWAALGEAGQVRASRMWVRMTFWLIGLFIVMQTLFRHEPLMQFGGLYFLIVTWVCWMLTSGFRQITYVRNLCGNNYTPRKLGRAVLIGGGGWVIYSMVSVSVGMGLALFGIDPVTPPNADTETGVVIRMPEGAEKPIVEPLSAQPAPSTGTPGTH